MTEAGHSHRSQPNGLLAALLPFGALVQPEVALTRSIWWLLGLDGAAGALHGLTRASGFEPDDDGAWLTEVVSADGGRTDLEYRPDGSRRPSVVVEAKIGHTLTVAQLVGYRERLPEDGGLLVVLTPDNRRREAELVLARLREAEPDERLRLAIWTYDEVAAAFETALPDSSDVAQFRGLVDAAGALDVAPLSASELLDDDPTRRADIWRVVDEASFGLFGKRLPAGADWSLARRRYVELGPFSVGMAVGVGRKSRVHEGRAQPWAWVRLPDSAAFHWVAQSVAVELRAGETSRDPEGLWVPLDVPVDVPGAVMIPAVRAELESLAGAIREAVACAVGDLDTVAPEYAEFAEPLLGMPGIDAADLLDDSDARLDDIRLVLRQAARIFGAARYPELDDDDYAKTRWIPVAGFRTHVSTCVGRRTPRKDGQPQPWAWLRIHQETPDAGWAMAALESQQPDDVVHDPHGVAVPLRIPPSEPGSRMLEAVRDQMHAVMVALRAVLNHH